MLPMIMVEAAMPGDDLHGGKQAGLSITVKVYPLDADAEQLIMTSGDGLTGDIAQLIDTHLDGLITGQWACAIKVSRMVR